MSDNASPQPEITLPRKPLHVRVALVEPSNPAHSAPLVDLLPSPADNSAWLGERLSVVGWGRAWRTEVVGRTEIRDAGRAWDTIRGTAEVDAPGDAPAFPIAIGSFGFAWATPGYLDVPEVTVVDAPSGRWVATAAVGTTPADPLEALDIAARERAAAPVDVPTGLWTEAGRMSQSKWLESVRRLIGRLQNGAASKVVMSRDMVVSAAAGIDERFLLSRLHELYPTTWAYCMGGLIGATPEMLVSMDAGTVSSRVLAGTAEVGGGEELMASMKDRTEHMLAVESVARALGTIADTLDVDAEPSLLELPNVVHLATEVTATVPDGNVLDVAHSLHPTAAVCGTPTKLAWDLLETFESTRRGRYSGPVGWIDAEGDGEFGIALRCGQISRDRRHVRVFAGGGIMPDSVPEAELVETRAKMKPVLDALGVDARGAARE